MNDLTPTFTSNFLLPPVPKFLADLLSSAGEQTEQEPRGGIPPLSYGKLLPEDRLTSGYYAVPVRGTPSPGLEDYRRLGELKGPAIAPEQLIAPHQLVDNSPQ